MPKGVEHLSEAESLDLVMDLESIVIAAAAACLALTASTIARAQARGKTCWCSRCARQHDTLCSIGTSQQCRFGHT